MQTPLDPAVKKAYEMGYALLRVAAVLPSQSFASALEEEALNLLRAVVGNRPEGSRKALGIIHYLVTLGRDTNNIHSENAEVLLRQVEALNSLLQERASRAVTPADIDQIFSSTPAGSYEPEPAVAKSRIAESRVAEPSREERALPKSELDSANAFQERQNVILDRIRQSGNCRTRDLQAILPDLSERTLRYDLQRLIADGKVERGGGGGPASWYRIKGDYPQSNVSGGASL